MIENVSKRVYLVMRAHTISISFLPKKKKLLSTLTNEITFKVSSSARAIQRGNLLRCAVKYFQIVELLRLIS